MANDKKYYQTVISALTEHAAITSISNKLKTVYSATEDDDLKHKLSPVIVTVNEIIKDAPPKVRSLKGSLQQQVRNEPYKSLVEYCQGCINSIKPQWQIIAERNGWGPKTP